MGIIQNTQIDCYPHNKFNYFVKREDLSCLEPAPPSAKMRGLTLFLNKLKQKGVTEVGYMDTAISMAGWGVAFFAKEMGLKAVLYYPKYKDGYRYNQAKYIAKWALFGAEIVPIQHPTQHQINIHKAKRDFFSKYPKGIWLPNGLKFNETTIAVKNEMQNVFLKVIPKTIVCSVGSGVMLSGIFQGLLENKIKVCDIFGILVTKGVNKNKKVNEILSLSEFDLIQNGIFAVKPLIKDITNDFTLIDSLYDYHDKPFIDCPFPCNEYYDLKAFEWMIKNIKHLKKPILFWNIGA